LTQEWRISRGFRAARRRRLSSICEKAAKNCLLRLFRPLPLAKADTRTAAVLVNELDSGFLESSLDFLSGCLPPSKPALRRFQALYGWKRDASSRR
jgi:hypothetical protein